MSSGNHGDILGRVLGALTFLGGVVLLGIVFHLAYGLFMSSSEQALGLTFTGNPKLDPPAIKIGIQFGWLIARIIGLFIMAVSSSLMAQKGINFYFSCLRGAPVDMMHKVSSTPPPVG